MGGLVTINAFASRVLTKDQKRKLRPLRNVVNRLTPKKSLIDLATMFHTDKWNGHWYAQHYEHHFSALRNRRINILEVGIGGNENPQEGGNSLRMWKAFFPRANIFGIDLFDKRPHDERRIKTFRGSQDDPAFLETVVREIGRLDIIVDDGSHQNAHVIKTFETLFPLLADDGIYAVEDTQTSYWAAYGGSSRDLDSRSTIMGYLKGLIDGLNVAEIKEFDRQETYLDRHIVAMHFYHGLVFVQKGLNNEGSYRY